MLIATIVLAGVAPPPALAADHKEAPIISEDPTADIADVYAFLNPRDASKLVLAMTVNPFSVPAEGIAFRFSPNVRYQFRVDNGGSAITHDLDITFQNNEDGTQTVRAKLPGNIVVEGDVTQPTEEPKPNPPIIIEGPDGVRLFAGPRDDPFFFDVVGFFRFLAGTGGFTGSDGFAGFNVSAIVLELPISLVQNGDNPLQIWGVTERQRMTIRRAAEGMLEIHRGPWQQIERMGNPAINTALIPPGLKDLFNISHPVDDGADFAEVIVASLQSLGTNDENIAILASVAVPDTLKLDADAEIGYPNGRAPADDVIDTLLFFIFNQQDVPDGVDTNDRPFLNEFPYLAPPWQPE